ncbi:MAG: oligosaccharide repeat unit polymerase [candidate division Zixibacteria bacterium]|nr:oligosaccharide repeat unit polymerase [candidate division Zixibacteria bacterium]
MRTLFKATNLFSNHGIANTLFIVCLCVFTVDRVLNYFIHAPIFVASSLIIIPVIPYFCIIKQGGNNPEILVIISIFALIAIINNLIYEFHIKNISDLSFILLFIICYYLYRSHKNHLSTKLPSVFYIISILLFIVSYFGIESGSIFTNSIIDGFSGTKVPKLSWDANSMDEIEVMRSYHQGFFRVAHIASYFFGFISLYYFYLFSKDRRYINLLLSVVAVSFCLYTGSRTFIVAFFISVFLSSLRKKYIVYSGAMTAIAVMIVLNLKSILGFIEGTFLYQYFSLIETVINNFSRLSRYRIWYSWYHEVKEFGFVDYLIGKTYYNSHIANAVNLKYPVWFHNDFLNIFYAYGIICLLLYSAFCYKIYYDNKPFIKNNAIIFVFYFTMLISAFFNGLYYYFPVFLLFLFFLMLEREKQEG